jgi:hypothetical protein
MAPAGKSVSRPAGVRNAFYQHICVAHGPLRSLRPRHAAASGSPADVPDRRKRLGAVRIKERQYSQNTGAFCSTPGAPDSAIIDDMQVSIRKAIVTDHLPLW